MPASTNLQRIPARVFGVPIGGFGLFSSVLISLATGFLFFFAAAFVAILSILFYNTIGHHSVDLATSYKSIAFPVGLAVLAVCLVFMLALWVRRKISGN